MLVDDERVDITHPGHVQRPLAVAAQFPVEEGEVVGRVEHDHGEALSGRFGDGRGEEHDSDARVDAARGGVFRGDAVDLSSPFGDLDAGIDEEAHVAVDAHTAVT